MFWVKWKWYNGYRRPNYCVWLLPFVWIRPMASTLHGHEYYLAACFLAPISKRVWIFTTEKSHSPHGMSGCYNNISVSQKNIQTRMHKVLINLLRVIVNNVDWIIHNTGLSCIIFWSGSSVLILSLSHQQCYICVFRNYIEYARMHDEFHETYAY